MPILALNCRLQEVQVNVIKPSVGPLVFAFSALSFSFTDSLSFIESCSLLMRPRHFDNSCAVGSQDPIGILKSFREAFTGSLKRFF